MFTPISTVANSATLANALATPSAQRLNAECFNLEHADFENLSITITTSKKDAMRHAINEDMSYLLITIRTTILS